MVIRVVVGGDRATRTGGRSKQRPYHEGGGVHGPTARRVASWTLTVRHLDVRPAGYGRTNGAMHCRTPCPITPLR